MGDIEQLRDLIIENFGATGGISLTFYMKAVGEMGGDSELDFSKLSAEDMRAVILFGICEAFGASSEDRADAMW
eukprot:8765038-Pyramimonas_sp.AAC.1